MRRAAALALLGVAATFPTSDDFSGPIGPPWQASGGTWSVFSGRAKVATSQFANGSVFLVRDIGISTGFTVEADITLSPKVKRANAGLTLLWKDSKNHLFCKTEVTSGNPNGLMSIGRKIGGTVKSLLAKAAPTGFVNGGTYHVSCGRVGGLITMTAGSRTITYQLTSSDKNAFGSATRVGLRSHVASDEDDKGSLYDNFTVS